MARTPLLRALRQLAREHDAAEHLGITPAEFRHRRTLELSRRDFLRGAAGAAAIAALAPNLKFAPALGGAGASDRHRRGRHFRPDVRR